MKARRLLVVPLAVALAVAVGGVTGCAAEDGAPASVVTQAASLPSIDLTPRLREQRAECGFAAGGAVDPPRYGTCVLGVTVDEVKTWLLATRSWIEATREVYLQTRGQLLRWAPTESRLACLIRENEADLSLEATVGELKELFRNTYGRPYRADLCVDPEPSPSLTCAGGDDTPRCVAVRAWAKLDAQYREVQRTADAIRRETLAWDFGFTERCTHAELASSTQAEVLAVAEEDARYDPRPADARPAAPPPPSPTRWKAQAHPTDYRRRVADALFAGRGDRKKRLAAACHYEGIVQRVTDPLEIEWGTEQLARLYALEAIEAPAESRERFRAATQCVDSVRRLEPATFGKVLPIYAYWTSYCLVLRAPAHRAQPGDGPADAQARGFADNNRAYHLAGDGRRIDETYEGGGMYRVAVQASQDCEAMYRGGVAWMCHSTADNDWLFAQRAVASPAYSGSTQPDTDTGNYFYDVYSLMAAAQAKRGERAHACAVVSDALARLGAGDWPVGREPETRVAERRLKQQKEWYCGPW